MSLRSVTSGNQLSDCYIHGVLAYGLFGVENGNQCFCGDYFHHFGEKPLEECSKKCSGEAGETCGGGWRIQISTTGLNGQCCYCDSLVTDSLPILRFSNPL